MSDKNRSDVLVHHLFLRYFRQYETIEEFKHLIENIDDYLKALYLELRSIEKYLNIFINHKDFRNLQEFLSIHDLLINRLGLLIQTILKFSLNLERIKNFYHSLNTDQKSVIRNSKNSESGIKLHSLFIVLETFKDINLDYLFQDFNNTRRIFVEIIESAIYELKDNDVSIQESKRRYYNFEFNILRKNVTDDNVIVASAKNFKFASRNLWKKLKKLRNIEKNLKIHHLHSYPDKFGDRRYVLHIVGGLGSFAGIQALIRFLRALPDEWQGGLSDTQIFQKIINSEHTIRNEKTKEIVFAEFNLYIHGKKFQVVFTNDESKIPSRQHFFNLKKLVSKSLHYGQEDYVYFLKNLITQHNASLVYIICNTASAPEELVRLSHLTHSFIYDLPLGFVNNLKSINNSGVIFLSTIQLFSLKTYQKYSENHFTVYETIFGFDNGIEKISHNAFYERLTDELTNTIQNMENETYDFKYAVAKSFLDLLIYIDLPNQISSKLSLSKPFIIGLCCTEFPLAKDWLLNNLQVFKERLSSTLSEPEIKSDLQVTCQRKLNFIEKIEHKLIIFKDPLDTGNANIMDYLNFKSEKSILTEDVPVGGPHNYDKHDDIPHH